MKKILVVRNDKIGDFMLAWPSFAMLKHSLPDAQITALVPSYTQPLAQLCPWIDEIIVDPTEKGKPEAKKNCLEQLKQAQFDAAIALFSNQYNAQLLWKARIPYRLAPATKWVQILYHRRIKQRRSRSLKPEFDYNLDLIRAFLADQKQAIVEPQTPYLAFSASEVNAQKAKLAQHLDLSLEKPWLMVHSGSGGSANNLSLAQYCQLLCGLAEKAQIILTAGPGEEASATTLHSLLTQAGVNSALYSKNEGLVDFSRSLACADAFIAGSTGPLHIAGALDVPTIGFFPAKRSATPLRWQPLNSAGRHLAFCPPPAATKEAQADMSRIPMERLIPTIQAWLVKFGF